MTPMTANQLRQRLIVRLALLTGSTCSHWSTVIVEIEETKPRSDHQSNWSVRATCGLYQGAAIRVVVNEAIIALREEVPFISGFW